MGGGGPGRSGHALLLNRNWNEAKQAEEPRAQPQLSDPCTPPAPHLRGHHDSREPGAFVFNDRALPQITPKEKIFVFC